MVPLGHIHRSNPQGAKSILHSHSFRSLTYLTTSQSARMQLLQKVMFGRISWYEILKAFVAPGITQGKAESSGPPSLHLNSLTC